MLIVTNFSAIVTLPIVQLIMNSAQLNPPDGNQTVADNLRSVDRSHISHLVPMNTGAENLSQLKGTRYLFVLVLKPLMQNCVGREHDEL